MKEIYNIKELSNYLKISPSEIRKLVRQNKIPYFRVGNRIKFEKQSINEWIENLEKDNSRNSIFID
jgi:excisionase family DNA binding protein